MLINCSPAFVMKLSRIHGLARLGRIYSILAPYRCPRCASDALRRAQDRGAGWVVSPHRGTRVSLQGVRGTDGVDETPGPISPS